MNEQGSVSRGGSRPHSYRRMTRHRGKRMSGREELCAIKDRGGEARAALKVQVNRRGTTSPRECVESFGCPCFSGAISRRVRSVTSGPELVM